MEINILLFILITKQSKYMLNFPECQWRGRSPIPSKKNPASLNYFRIQLRRTQTSFPKYRYLLLRLTSDEAKRSSQT